MSATYWIAAGLAFVVAVVAPLGLIPLLERVGAVDVPNSRSSHSHHVLRGAGLAQALGAGAALALVLVVSDAAKMPIAIVLSVLIATALLGWVEDTRGLPASVRAAAQIMIGAVAAGTFAHMSGHSLWWSVVGGIAVVGLVNVANFMDGVNAMSAAHGIVCGVAFVVVGTVHDTSWVVAVGAILTAIFLAFLPWNFDGRLFLGDTGSFLFGGVAAIVIVMAWIDGLPLIALAAPFAVYVADTGVTLACRVRAGERWHEAHRDHIYQRLNRRGLPHLTVTGIVATASCMSAALGLATTESAGAPRYLAAAGIVAILLSFVALRSTVGLPETSKAARGGT